VGAATLTQAASTASGLLILSLGHLAANLDPLGLSHRIFPPT
jgi:hypothetical protein